MLRREEGVALVVAISLTLILSAMALGIVTLSITEKGISQNQKFGIQALYNADSAIEIAKQQMMVFSQAKMESLRMEWPGSGPIIASPTTFFPDSGISYECQGLGCDVVTTFSFVDSGLASTSQTFNFRYVSTAEGGAYEGSGASTIISEGDLRLSASRGSFSDYLIFTDVHYTPGGSQIWFHTSGYFDGRVHSNGKMRFAYFPTFEDLVTQVPSQSSYYNDGSPIDLDADRNGDRDVPNFYGGFDRGAPNIPLPGNSFCQERAALGMAAADTTPVPLSEKRAALGLPDTGEPVPEGIYIPNDGSAVTGGIYVAGDLDECRFYVNEDGNQAYKMTDQNGIIKTVEVDHEAMTTSVTVGASTTTFSGVPRGMLYSTGLIDDFGGLDRDGDEVPVAVDSETQLTVTAVDDIRIDRDIIYEDIDNSDCILGVYSSSGDVIIETDAPDDLMLDTFVMATGDKGAFTVDEYDSGSYRGAVHLRGGVVQRYYGAFGTFSYSGSQTGYGRDFRYDRRGISPPYYPTTTLFNVDQPVPHVKVWREA